MTMVCGTPLPWRPEMIYGRIGGNLDWIKLTYLRSPFHPRPFYSTTPRSQGTSPRRVLHAEAINFAPIASPISSGVCDQRMALPLIAIFRGGYTGESV